MIPAKPLSLSFLMIPAGLDPDLDLDGSPDPVRSRMLEVIRHMWGYGSLRPLQEAAIRAGLEGRDSLVVAPTGGGKSLCYQAPPLIAGRTDVVVSPLIALMKDQVDGLRANGYPAVALHSNLDLDELRAAEAAVAAGSVRLVFAAPERLLAPGFLGLMQRAGVQAFAIDEAHCISQWGHDFRPEYRELATLRAHFPRASMHAFTATATERVRTDIATQLALRDPLVLVGDFDRPNLTYRVIRGVDAARQLGEVLDRHHGDACIVYALSRRDTEAIAERLRHGGVNAAAYHAGLDAATRRRVQDDFAADRVDVVVATVAFGMGIDRSNIRAVVHVGMPQSIEHYQQETGRAGRDGLPAECALIYSPADLMRWERIFTKSDEPIDPEHLAARREALRRVQSFASGSRCRHRGLVEYFGQSYDKENCGACDVCLDEQLALPDSTMVARKILSCVARVGQRFGAGHVADVLAGKETEAVARLRHNELSTFGLLGDFQPRAIVDLIHQLVDRECLQRTPGDRPILQISPLGWAVMKGEQEVSLAAPPPARSRRERERRAVGARQIFDEAAVDAGLFQHLRKLRSRLAGERGVPAYIIFGDATLLALAARRPSTPAAMRQVPGVGDHKLADLGPAFLAAIAEYEAASDLAPVSAVI